MSVALSGLLDNGSSHFVYLYPTRAACPLYYTTQDGQPTTRVSLTNLRTELHSGLFVPVPRVRTLPIHVYHDISRSVLFIYPTVSTLVSPPPSLHFMQSSPQRIGHAPTFLLAQESTCGRENSEQTASFGQSHRLYRLEYSN